ncbi:putative bifunctional diguanylate cyclase/phosphodiesterase [Thiosocius teredinicola]|uniref:putative bifunctional diguanylate cyclase/phosphodiesterase n=1 Tax=Thiosocius teredinicola TaxID=1973002 RepID=UPI000F76B61B
MQQTPPTADSNPLVRRYDVRTMTALGFGLVIALFLVSVVAGFHTKNQHHASLSQLVRETGMKTVLAYTMREAIRERVDSLRTMVRQYDVFARDEEKMRYFGYASKYSRARASLLSHVRTDAEQGIMDGLDADARSVGPANSRALSALFNDQATPRERRIAVQAAIDGHLALLQHVDELVRTIHQGTQQHIRTANNDFEDALLMSTLLGIIAVIMAIATAAFVVINAGSRQSKLSYQASHDPLTGLLNRQAFEATLRTVLEQSEVELEHHALLMLDLDRFKLVNDTCGHAAGDALLREVADRLAKLLRHADVLARIGGDEFAVLLRFTDTRDAEQVAEKMRRSIEEYTFGWDNQVFKIGASIGLVPFGTLPITLTQLMNTADACCYTAKEEGRNRVHRATGDLEALTKRSSEIRWVSRISDAVQHDRFVLYGQIIKALNPSKDDGYLSLEILVRMKDEQGLGLITPGQFMPAAERHDMVPEIDRWVVRHTLDWLADLGDTAEQLRVSINISGASALDAHFHRFVRQCIKETDVPPASLCFEISESTAVRSLSSVAAIIDALGDLGCRFALDDFGSGLAAFNQLRNVDIDYLKIDGALVHNLDRDPINRALVESISRISKKLGKRTIAEFVENHRVKKILQSMDIDHAQGFAIHRPEPLSNIQAQIVAAQDHLSDLSIVA